MKPALRRKEAKDRNAGKSPPVLKVHSAPDSDRTSPEEILAAAVKLCENLAVSNKLTVEFSDRVRALWALSYMITFILRIDKRGGLLTPLIKLRNALSDLERGIMPPMFKVKRTDHRPPDSFGRHMTKGAAAAAMSALMGIGLNRKQAATRIADVLEAGGVKLGKRPWATVASWRDQISNSPVRDWYVEWKNTMTGPPPEGEREREQFMLDVFDFSGKTIAV